MATRHRSQREPRTKVRNLDRRVSDALTDLSAYALTLELECHRLDNRMLELAEQESSSAERRALVRKRTEIGEELEELRKIIRALASTLAGARRTPRE